MSRPPSILFKPKEIKSMNLGQLIDNSGKSKTLFSSPVKSTVSSNPSGPKVLFGGNTTKRNRINVTDEELEKYIDSPEDKKYINQARKNITVTNTDNLRLEYVLDIGKSVQDRYQPLLSDLLGISNHSFITKTKSLFAQIVEALNKFDTQKSHGFLSKMFSNQYKEEKTFTEAYAEIQEYIKQLQTIMPNLSVLAKSVQAMDAQFVSINNDLKPYIISCAFFSEYKADNFPTDLFISRQSSLISTQVSIKVNRQQATVIHRFIIELIDVFNNVVLTDIPAWCNSYIASQIQKTSLSETQIEQQKQIINQLKTKIS